MVFCEWRIVMVFCEQEDSYSVLWAGSGVMFHGQGYMDSVL